MPKADSIINSVKNAAKLKKTVSAGTGKTAPDSTKNVVPDKNPVDGDGSLEGTHGNLPGFVDELGDANAPDIPSRIGKALSRDEFNQKYPESDFPSTDEFSSKELQESAFKHYNEALTTPKEAVIGRLEDTNAARDLNHFYALKADKWSQQVNDAWVDGLIDGKKDVYIASHTTKANLENPPDLAKKYGRNTVFGTEVEKLEKAGYVRKGDYFIHPENISKGD